MKKRVLVTGGAGFIGAHLIHALSSQNFEVLGVDNFSDYYSVSMKRARIADLDIEDVITKADISNKDEFGYIIKNFSPEVVVNLAAQGGVRASKQDPYPYILTNQVGFINALTLSVKNGVQKFIYASSSSVYGNSQNINLSESDKLNAPESLYGLSKLANELMAKHFETGSLQKIGLRLFTVYGPWGRPDMAMFRLLASAKIEERFKLTASLDLIRDFTYIQDVVRVISEIISEGQHMGRNELFNVSGGKPHSMRELLEILNQLNISIKYDQMDSDKLDVFRTDGSTKLLAERGFSVPSTSLISGVKNTANWISAIQNSKLSEWYKY